MTWWMICAAGAAGGLLGALGMGAGTVLIMFLRGVAKLDQLTAQAINLIFFLPVAALSLFLHSKNGLTDWKQALVWIAAGVPGALLGVWLSSVMPVQLLSRLFGAFLLCVGIRELCTKKK